MPSWGNEMGVDMVHANTVNHGFNETGSEFLSRGLDRNPVGRLLEGLLFLKGVFLTRAHSNSSEYTFFLFWLGECI